MAITVNTPDGGQASFPDGMDPQQIAGIMRQKFGGPSAPEMANQAGQAAGQGESALQAGIGQAAQAVPFDNYINAGARYAAQRLTGVKQPDDFQTDLEYARGKSQGEIEGHPVAGTVGGVAGALATGAGAGTALNAVGRAIPVVGRAAELLAPVVGKPVQNVAKSALVNGAVGGSIGLASGQDLPQAGETAALSAVGGPVAEKVAGFALSKLQPAAQRAMSVLADHLNESPSVLQSAYQAFQNLTGRVPSIAELAGLKSQGKLRALAADNPTIGEAAMTAQQAGGAPLHVQVNAMPGATRPQTVAGQLDFRDAQMDNVMNMPHPQTGVALKDTHAPDPQGLMLDPHVEYALRPNTAINARIGQASPVMDRIQNDQATIGDVETVRKALRDVQNGLLRPAPGSQSSKDPILAKEFGDLASKIEGVGISADPDYGKALGQYRDLTHYNEGFQHGLTGKALADAPADDNLRRAALKTPMGVAGYEHGNALAIAKQSLDNIAPGNVRPQQGLNATHAMQAVAGAAAPMGGAAQAYHAMRAVIPGLHLPEGVQQRIAAQLFANDAPTVRAGIANLQRAGRTAQEIRQIGTMIGGTTGARIASYATQGGPQ